MKTTIKYPDKIPTEEPETEEFFTKSNIKNTLGDKKIKIYKVSCYWFNADILGELVTTTSKFGSATLRQHDPARNKLPIPLFSQTCKREKFWGGNANTIELTPKQLKDIFLSQLSLIHEVWCQKKIVYLINHLHF